MPRTALITGIGGQDGAYLARLLLEEGYRVVGGRRPAPDGAPARLHELGIAADVELVDLALPEMPEIVCTLERLRPDEIYNLAAQSDVARSFVQPVDTANTNAIGPLRLLEAIRQAVPSSRFFQASSAEMFGRPPASPQDETTPLRPHNPYGAAKAFAHWTTASYRDGFGLHAGSGILFNHESPLRGRQFVTRKITFELARIRHGQPGVLELGNLDAQRDWGFAGDYVRGMRLMLQQPRADDFVFASGQLHSVRGFVAAAADRLGFRLDWTGEGLHERAVDRRTGRTIVQVNPAFFRPVEPERLVGNAAKARSVLGWNAKMGFAELVGMMAEADDRRVQDGGETL